MFEIRNLQDGSIEVDSGKAVSKRSPGKLRQLNTDTGLYVGVYPFLNFHSILNGLHQAILIVLVNGIRLIFFIIFKSFSIGGMPDIMYYTSRRYYSGIIGCISEIVLGGELKLSLDPETLGTAHNVEPGYF